MLGGKAVGGAAAELRAAPRARSRSSMPRTAARNWATCAAIGVREDRPRTSCSVAQKDDANWSPAEHANMACYSHEQMV
jgi:hypothetical protein